MNAKHLSLRTLFCSLWLFIVAAQGANGDELTALARVERNEVFLGESLALWIEVRGSDAPAEPDVSVITDFRVQSLGGQTRNSESVTIINGRMSRIVRRGYVFSYRLTPKRTGQLTIPSLEVLAGGQKLRTRPLAVRVKEPTETEDFKLRLALSKAKCYVGEPVTLTVTWYIGKDVRGFEFQVPVLDDGRFASHDVEVRVGQGKKYYRVPLGTGEVIAEKGQGSLEGKTYATLSFRKVLIPRQAGTFRIPKATVACEALVGYRRNRDFFGDFFSDNFFGMGERGVYQRFVTPSNSLALVVLGVPREGRPQGFAGHVGRYRIEATATPTEANVGDPITLTIKLSGPEYLGDVELPPLKDQPALARDFRIPDEMAPGKVEGKVKSFTQTIRATHPEVKQIPPIELPYFDTETGRYGVARTKPIPLTIHKTHVLTASDAEGRQAGPLKSELTEWTKGIAHNYEDLSVLENQAYGLATVGLSPFWMAATLGPLAIYIVLLLSTVLVRRARADPERRRAKKAYGQLKRSIRELRTSGDASRGFGQVLTASQCYLGKKLGLTSAAITYRDVEERLKARGVGTETLADLKQLFEDCEARHYAGTLDGAAEVRSICDRALDLAERLEAALK